jgi:hypothetical protein
VQRAIGYALLAIWLLAAPGAGGPPAADASPSTSFRRVSQLQGGAELGRNRPVVGASVLVRRSDDPSHYRVTSTDVNGRFRVAGLADGEYRVELRREGLRPVVKQEVEVRFPSRAVLEVTMEPLAAVEGPEVPPPDGALPESAPRVALRGQVVGRDKEEALPDVPLHLARPDGRADPVVLRTAEDGTFEVSRLPAGPWRLEARVVGYLPVRVPMNFDDDARLTVSMVPQPAGYDPSPLDLMPVEQPIPPERFRSPRPEDSGELDEADSETSDESQGRDAR